MPRLVLFYGGKRCEAWETEIASKWRPRLLESWSGILKIQTGLCSHITHLHGVPSQLRHDTATSTQPPGKEAILSRDGIPS